MDPVDLQTLWSYNTYDTWFLVASVAAALVLGRILGLFLRRLSSVFSAQGRTGWSQCVLDLIGPAQLVLLTAGLRIGLREAPDKLPPFWANVLLLLYSVAVIWYLFNVVSVLDALLRRFAVRSGTGLDQLVPLVRKMLRIVIVVLGALFVLQNVFDQNIGAWLAGVGIAGLAISLAAQDSLKTLFGSIAILLDQPFKIGDRIIFAGHDGTVEEIGFRSIKLRTGTGSLVTIPNSDIVNKPVENVARRRSIYRAVNVTIPQGTPAAKIRQAVDILRGILEEDGIREPIHRVIGGQPPLPRVYFQDFDAQRLTISVLYWYAPPEYWDFMDHAQRLNLRIFEEFEKAGIDFCLPTVIKTVGKETE